MPIEKVCTVTGQKFIVTDEEMALRKKLGVEGEPEYFPAFRFMQLGAFWQHWNLHKRKCDKTGKDIISVFGPDSPYPVWHKDEWVKSANPPSTELDEGKEVFPQLWELFRKSPIAHNMGTGTENCEYTDDWWYSKNCYLCHSGVHCEDVAYLYRCVENKDSQFCVFSWQSELSSDAINCHNGFQLVYALSCHQCHDSAFLYDCRNCSDCLLCWNLRNKQYCFMNKQLTKEEYMKKKAEWPLTSYEVYTKAIAEFRKMMKEQAYHRAQQNDKCENVTGNYLDSSRNLTDCYFTSDQENCINCTRQGWTKDALDCLGVAINAELAYCCSLAQDKCYDSKFDYNLIQCNYCTYCAHCFQCEYCFGCCGLVGKKYHIMNKAYSPEEYEKLKAKIVAKMKETGEYGKFFPGYFAATPYEESWSGYHWPLSREMQEKFGFRLNDVKRERPEGALDVSEIPDDAMEATAELAQKTFWDADTKRPFQIRMQDIAFCQKLGIPLPHCFYAKRLQENFRYMPFDGTMREVKCGKCGVTTKTSWPKEYDGRILCEECYVAEVA